MPGSTSSNGTMAPPTAAVGPEQDGHSEKAFSLTDLRNLVKAGAIDTVLLAVPTCRGG
ncbi:hypothetical protein [Streptomyces echinatus]|uniref:hypothetical protein n=1 Tax=Streptomyces echinatus TaxID=67293 RepID=UPI0037A1DB21